MMLVVISATMTVIWVVTLSIKLRPVYQRITARKGR